MTLATDQIREQSISAGWAETARALMQSKNRSLYHLVTRISNPEQEDAAIRTGIDGLLERKNLPRIGTVANTIFPVELAQSSRDVEHLSSRYRELYPRLKRFPGSQRGTYFGRLVEYPTSKGNVDQLTGLVRKLQQEVSRRGPYSVRYEVNVESPALDQDQETRGDSSPTSSLSIYATSVDTIPRAFPCLSHCSFQLDHGVLHLVAHYRSQYLVARAYGNYLGLAHLLQYVSRTAELAMGELMVVAGKVQIDPEIANRDLNAIVL